jgi:hypothetical protein
MYWEDYSEVRTKTSANVDGHIEWHPLRKTIWPNNMGTHMDLKTSIWLSYFKNVNLKTSIWLSYFKATHMGLDYYRYTCFYQKWESKGGKCRVFRLSEFMKINFYKIQATYSFTSVTVRLLSIIFILCSPAQLINFLHCIRKRKWSTQMNKWTFDYAANGKFHNFLWIPSKSIWSLRIKCYRFISKLSSWFKASKVQSTKLWALN